jgi:hypothetical protein
VQKSNNPFVFGCHIRNNTISFLIQVVKWYFRVPLICGICYRFYYRLPLHKLIQFCRVAYVIGFTIDYHNQNNYYYISVVHVAYVIGFTIDYHGGRRTHSHVAYML